MATRLDRLRRAAATLLTVLALALLVVSLALLAETTQNSEEFGRLHLLILSINSVGVVVLLVLIAGNLVRLGGEYRRHLPGARLKARMVAILTVLAVVPLMVVYAFSLQFLTRGIDSWFNVEVERGLDEALNVSRAALDLRMREYLNRTALMGPALAGSDDASLVTVLGKLRQDHGATEVTVFAPNSRIVAVSSELPAGAVPLPPPDEVLLQVRGGRPYVGLEPGESGGLQVRTAAALPVSAAAEQPRVLQAVYPITERLSYLAEIVRASRDEYKRLAYLRTPLTYSFTLTLTLVLLLSLLMAVWGALFSARRLVAPIQDLVAGTRAVAKGDFDTRLPVPARDEIGFLVNSFNDMTRRLAEAREQAQLSQQAVESERASLEAILASLSTGVVALEPDLSVRIANQAARAILGVDFVNGQPLEELARGKPMLEQFLQMFVGRLEAGDTDWRGQVLLHGEAGRRALMCAWTGLPGEGERPGGHVLVFDDVTTLVQAQREAAWGEVARRMAHEIKNPLTPIQLSAERMRRKYLASMSDNEARVLDRATHTIIQQVEAMKDMVDAFRDYARAPDMELSRFDLNRLVGEVCELYRVREIGVELKLSLDGDLPPIEADAGRLRQILHNLITNALEALHGREDGLIDLGTRLKLENGYRYAEIQVADNGPGFRAENLQQVFDPYVTTKPKGTGLGLAIVRKIVEEHGGRIELANRDSGGAQVNVTLPIEEAGRATMSPRTTRREPGAEAAARQRGSTRRESA